MPHQSDGEGLATQLSTTRSAKASFTRRKDGTGADSATVLVLMAFQSLLGHVEGGRLPLPGRDASNDAGSSSSWCARATAILGCGWRVSAYFLFKCATRRAHVNGLCCLEGRRGGRVVGRRN